MQPSDSYHSLDSRPFRSRSRLVAGAALMAMGVVACAGMASKSATSHERNGEKGLLRLQAGLRAMRGNKAFAPSGVVSRCSGASKGLQGFPALPSSSLFHPSPMVMASSEQVLNKHPQLLKLWSQNAPSRGLKPLRASLEDQDGEEVDLFRETLLRYMGYANEVGEAFRGFVGPNGVFLSYVIASGYVVSDSLYQGYRTNKKLQGATNLNVKNTRVAVTAAESLVWQSLASVAIPGFTINRCVALAHFALGNLYKSELWHDVSASTTEQVDHWGPTLFGLAMIPLIVRPIDTAVESSFERYVRPPIEQWLNEYEAKEMANSQGATVSEKTRD